MANINKQPILVIIAIAAGLMALAVSAATLLIANRQFAELVPQLPLNTIESNAEPIAESSSVEAATTLQALTEELRQEQVSRLQLQRQVIQLEEELAANSERLADLQEQFDGSEPRNEGGLDAPLAGGGSEAAQQAHQAASLASAGNSFGGVFGRRNRTAQQRVASLLDAGIDEARATELVQRIDQNQLAELDLRDTAARGGWLESDEFDQQLEELEGSAPDLRSELGDSAYDRYLFANGTPNRVVISTVIDGSAANAAGIEVRDVVISYAGQRLFNVQELQQATRAGVRGESVPVLLRRGADNINLSVSRGPLGVTLTRDLQDPDT